MKNAAAASRESRHLSVVPTKELTRAQVAARLDVRISTVRRYAGERLHPRVDDHDVRWFAEKEVAAQAATLTNEPRVVSRRKAEPAAGARAERSPGEIAAQVFERLEQRQSLAEIVIGVRVEPELVRALYEQWCLGPGPCTLDEIVRRFGPGAYRVTAYGFEPAGLRWECFVSSVRLAAEAK